MGIVSIEKIQESVPSLLGGTLVCTTWFEVVVCLKILIKYITVIFNMMLHIAGFAQTYKLLNVSSFLLKLSKEKKIF